MTVLSFPAISGWATKQKSESRACIKSLPWSLITRKVSLPLECAYKVVGPVWLLKPSFNFKVTLKKTYANYAEVERSSNIQTLIDLGIFFYCIFVLHSSKLQINQEKSLSEFKSLCPETLA